MPDDVRPGSWVGDTVEEFKKLPTWGKIAVGVVILAVAGLGYYEYTKSKSTTPTIGTSSPSTGLGIPSGASTGGSSGGSSGNPPTIPPSSGTPPTTTPPKTTPPPATTPRDPSTPPKTGTSDPGDAARDAALKAQTTKQSANKVTAPKPVTHPAADYQAPPAPKVTAKPVVKSTATQGVTTEQRKSVASTATQGQTTEASRVAQTNNTLNLPYVGPLDR